jgi:hypothetical protein
MASELDPAQPEAATDEPSPSKKPRLTDSHTRGFEVFRDSSGMKPRLDFALPKAVVTKALRQLDDVESLIVPGPYSGAFDDEETDGLVIGGKDVRQVQRLRSKASMAVSYAPCCTLYVVCFVAGLGGSWRLLPRPCRVRYWPSPPARRRRTLPTYTEQHYRARHQAISCNGLLWLSQVLPKLLRAYQRLNGGASQLSKETIRSVALEGNYPQCCALRRHQHRPKG